MQEELRNNKTELIIFVAFEALFIFSLLMGFNQMITLIIATVLIIMLMMHSAGKGRSVHSVIERAKQELEQEKTNRKQIQEKLLENKKILQAFSNSFPETILMADSAEKIFFWNPALYSMFGFSEQEIMGKGVSELFSSADFSLNEISRKSGTENSDINTEIYNAVRENRNEFPAEITVSPLSLYNQQCYFICIRDRSLQKKKEEKLAELYSNDPLTKLFNRIHFFTLAASELERAKRYGNPLSLIIIDIDRLKNINEIYGNDTGDDVLRTLAEIIRNNIRNVDIPARLSGGEIAILLPNTDMEKAKVTAERLRESSENTIIPVRNESVSYTVSAGVAQIRKNTFNMDILLKDADTALFLAKEKGGNCVETCVYRYGRENM